MLLIFLYIKNMSQAIKQIEKLKDGGNVSSKLKYIVDGNSYELDEKELTDQFNPFFEQAKQKGYAKESDKSDWLDTYKTYIDQSKSGVYDIKSSGDTMLTYGYQGAGDAELGLDKDGKSINSHKLKTSNDRMAYVSKAFGDQIVKSFNKNQADILVKTTKEKEENDARLNDLENSRFDSFSSGLGRGLYTKDFDTAKELSMKDYWDKSKDDSRLSKVAGIWTDRMKQLNSLDFTSDKLFQDKYGMSISDFKEKANKFYDSETGKLKGDFSKLENFRELSNIFDTMGEDEGFYNKDVGLNVPVLTDEEKAAKQALEDAKPADVGGAFQNKQTNLLYKDKDEKELYDGMFTGKLYSKGLEVTGEFVNGTNYFDDPLNGYYIKGESVTKGKFDEWHRELAKDPNKNAGLLAHIANGKKHNNDIYNKQTSLLNRNKTTGVTNYIPITEIADQEASRFTYNDMRNNTAGVMGTSRIYGFDEDSGIRSSQFYKANDFDKFGRRVIWDKINIVDKKTGKPSKFTGKIKKDIVTNKYYMEKENGERYNDKNLTNALNKIKLNENAGGDHDFSFSLAHRTEEDIKKTNSDFKRATSRLPEGQKLKTGGNIKKLVLGGVTVNSAPPKRTQATTQEIYNSGSDYKLSNMDKAEMASLGLDAASFLTSLTGAGSVLSGSLGLASTVTSFGTDIARDGLDWGDAGRLVVNAGLDAASFIPGAGMVSSAGKFGKRLKSLGKPVLKALQYGMVTAGAGQAGKLLYDIATSDKKSFANLSIDEQRILLNGLQAVVGGSRLAGNAIATKKSAPGTEYIQTKKGKQPITPLESKTIRNADDKVKAAQEILNKKGLSLEDSELSTAMKMDLKLKKAWMPLQFRSEKDVVNITGGDTNRVLKTKEDYGDNKYMDWLTKRVALRNPHLRPEGFEGKSRWGVLGDYFNKDLDIKAPIKKTGVPTDLGYSPGPFKPPTKPQKELLALPEGRFSKASRAQAEAIAQSESNTRVFNSPQASVRETYSPDYKHGNTNITPEDINTKGNQSEQAKELIEKIKGVKTNNKTKGKVKNYPQDKAGKRTKLKLNGGTITKFFYGGKPEFDFIGGGDIEKNESSIPSKIKRTPLTTIPTFTSIKTGRVGLFDSSVQSKPFIKNKIGDNPFIQQGSIDDVEGAINGLKKDLAPSNIVRPQIIDGARALHDGYNKKGEWVTQGRGVVGKLGSSLDAEKPNFLGKLKEATKGIDPINASELARALYTRKINSRVDNRIERPMMTAMNQIPISVRGDLLTKNAYDNQANTLISSTNRNQTSDAGINAAINLEANTKATGLRMQGDLANNQMLNQTRQQSLENDISNAGNRMDVANKNIQTLASAEQGERAANNQKMLQMNYPIIDYWKQRNYAKMNDREYDRRIDSEIGRLKDGIEFNKQSIPLQTEVERLNNIIYDKNSDSASVAKATAEKNSIVSKYKDSEYEFKIKGLNDMRTNARTYKAGGQLSPEVKAANDLEKENVKQTNLANRQSATNNQKSIESDSDIKAKQDAIAMRSIQEMIKLALS